MGVFVNWLAEYKHTGVLTSVWACVHRQTHTHQKTGFYRPRDDVSEKRTDLKENRKQLQMFKPPSAAPSFFHTLQK